MMSQKIQPPKIRFKKKQKKLKFNVESPAGAALAQVSKLYFHNGTSLSIQRRKKFTKA